MAFNLFLLFIVSQLVMIESRDPQLQFVAVVFRHGDRAPDKSSEMFPTDPYINDTFYPFGLGGLTNNGKRRLYELGLYLRKNYNYFLGETYYPNILMGRSTDYERTKMSLLLVLSSLFPPLKSQRWNKLLNWQPIPTKYVPQLEDNLMLAELCPQYLTELERTQKLPEVIEKIEKFRPFMNNLTEITGRNISKPQDMFNLYHTFVAESSMGLTLPEWTKKIFPNGKLFDGIVLEYQLSNYNKKLRRLFGGMLLRNILHTMSDIVNKTDNSGRKINLYSGHETNVASVLLALDVYKPHVPEYGSAVLFELLSYDGTNFYVKTRYYRSIPSVTEDLQIPGCDNPCPFDDFVKLLADVIPSDDELKCVKT